MNRIGEAWESYPYVKRLDSGYWHVRFSREQFVQWPCGAEPAAEDVFHGFGRERELTAIASEMVQGRN